MPRFFIIVLDGVGAGDAPDAAEYGDEGANTLGNLARAEGGLHLPVMGSMGLGNVLPLVGVPETKTPTLRPITPISPLQPPPGGYEDPPAAYKEG